MLDYEKCLEIIREKFSKEIYHVVIKSNWFPLGGFLSKNVLQNSLVIFYEWKNKILKAQEIIKRNPVELLYEFRFYRETFNYFKESFYNDYDINIIDMLKLSRYAKLEEPDIAQYNEYNLIEIDCMLSSKNNMRYYDIVYDDGIKDINIYIPTILCSYNRVGPDTYIQWFEEIRYIEDIERNVHLYNFYPFLQKYFDKIKGMCLYGKN